MFEPRQVSPKRPNPFWRPPSLLFCAYGGFPGVKRPKLKDDHSPSSSAEVKNEWINTSTLPIRFRGEDSDSFAFGVKMSKEVMI
jgi:hypothetical protein